MQDKADKGVVLYFESDEPLSKSVSSYLTEKNYQVFHYKELPEQALASIKDQLPAQPSVVLIDLSIPENGLHICRLLREDYLDKNIPIVFISESMSEEDVLDAYDAGADDYLIKPMRLKELAIKLEKYQQLKQSRENQQEMMTGAQKMAFDAMATNSELGEILRFHEDSYSIKDLDELAALLLTAISKFSLKSSVMFFTHTCNFYRDDGKERPLEEKTLNAFKDQQRIFSWKNRTFFNYDYFSVLIRDMPIDDEARYGILKDQLCLLFNGVDARVKALTVERANSMKATTMRIAADTIAAMVMEIENDNVELSKQFENIIFKMEANISSDIIQFNLLENEEQVLLSHIMNAIKESSEIFETSLEKEKQYKDIMNKLLKELLMGA